MRPRVVLTGTEGAFAGLAGRLGQAFDVIPHPLITFEAPASWAPLDAALAALAPGDVVAVTSPRAADAVAARLRALGAARLPVPLFASGPASAAPLAAFASTELADTARVGAVGAGRALAERLRDVRPAAVLFPCGDQRRDELPAILAAAGIAVREQVCYHTVPASAAVAAAAIERADVLVVASPMVARLLAHASGVAAQVGARPALVAIGPTTAAAAEAAGWPATAVAATPDEEALAAAIHALGLR